MSFLDKVRRKQARIKYTFHRSSSRSNTLESPTPPPKNNLGLGGPVPTSAASTSLANSLRGLTTDIPGAVDSATNAETIVTSSSIVAPVGPSASQMIPRSNTPKSPLSPHNKQTPWTELNNLTRILDSTSGAFGPLKSTFEAISGCVKSYENTSVNREEYDLINAELEVKFQDLARFLGGPMAPTITPTIKSLAEDISREIVSLKQTEERTTVGRKARAIRDVDDALMCYRQINSLLDRLVQNANMNMWKIVDEQEMEHRLKKLGHSPAAWYSSVESIGQRSECTPQTRSQVLSHMLSWAHNGTSAKLYWLSGMAGTGKTTIAYSLSDILHLDGKLAASFFCSRQLPSCSNVNLILPTISYQLARFSYPFRHALSRKLREEPDIHTRQLSEQFQALIVGPLRAVQKTLPQDSVIVIDGLDECERNDAVDIVLEILLSEGSGLPIKFFITSRPEPKIINRMDNTRHKDSRITLRLHDLDHSIVRQDIQTYLKTELEYMNVSAEDLGTLTEQCGVLFIYAATAVRYVKAAGPGRSLGRLKEVLGVPTLSVSDKDTIDSLYTTILGAAFDNKTLEAHERAVMMFVLHTVICVLEPLTLAMIARLLEIRSEEIVEAALAPLASVLSISENSRLVTTLHASFPEYLFDQSRSGPFHCNHQTHNALLAHKCFDMMKTPSPPFNICMLESSFVLDKDVPDLEEKVDKAISAELFYACRYWCSHLELAETSEALFSALEDFLEERLLLWMEVMNLKRSMAIGARALLQLNAWSQKGLCSRDIRSMIMDARQFTTTFSLSPASQSTPHLYISTLAVWPEEQPISKCYSQRTKSLTKLMGTAIAQLRSPLRAVISTSEDILSIQCSPDGTHIVSGLEDGVIRIWDAYTGQVFGNPLEGHTHSVKSVSYSPNGAHIVSGAYDNTVRIWDAHTGQMIGHPLQGHTDWVYSVSYSPDGSRIISGSYDKTIRIWDAHTGQIVGYPLKGHTARVTSVSYSPDGARVVSGSYDKTIRIWDAHTGQTIGHPLQGHSAAVQSVSYSPDGTHIVSGSDDKTIRIWDADAGQAVGDPLKGHSGSIYSVSYSPDSVHIVSGANDHTIRIWDAHTGQIVGRPFEGHTAAIQSVSYSPDGACIVSGSYDQTIRIWDAHTGQTVYVPHEGHSDRVQSVSFSPDGARIVSGSYDQTIGIWDAYTGQMIGDLLQGHADRVQSVSFSPDGTRVVSGSYDKTIQIWDAQTGQKIADSLKGHTARVSSVSYSPDGARVVSGSYDRTIRIWDAHIGQTIGYPLEGHTDWVSSARYSPDGARVVSGSYDKTIRIWDAHTGQTIGHPLQGHSAAVQSVSYSPDGTHIVSGSDDKTIRIWDASTGQTVGDPLKGHSGSIYSVSYSPDGLRIVSGANDTTIRIWDAHTGQIIGHSLQGHTAAIQSVSYSPDGSLIVSGANDSTIRIWDAHTGQLVNDPRGGHTDRVQSVSYSPNGARIVSGAYDRTIGIWDARTGRMIGNPLEGHSAAIQSVSCSPDGSRIASGSDDKTIRIWDAYTGQTVGDPLKGHSGSIYSVSYSPDGTHIVSGGNDSTVRIWDARTGQMVGQPLEGHTWGVSSVSYSLDGRHIVSGSYDQTIRLWNSHTGQMIGHPLEGHTARVSSVSFSPDGSRIVSGAYDRTIRIWDARTGREVGEPLQGHTAAVQSVSYSPDGSHIVSSSDDKTILIWDAQTGQKVVDSLQGHAARVSSVSYSPDGAHIVSGSYDQSIRIWDSHTGHMLANSSLAAILSQDTLSDWSVDDHGWVVSSSSQPLIWIPSDLRPTLCSPRNMAVISKRGYLRLDFSNASLGPSWSHCY